MDEYKQLRITLPQNSKGVFDEIQEFSAKTNIPMGKLIVLAWKAYKTNAEYLSLTNIMTDKAEAAD